MNPSGYGQRADRGGADNHQPDHHRLLLPPLRGLRVVPGPLLQQHGDYFIPDIFSDIFS